MAVLSDCSSINDELMSDRNCPAEMSARLCRRKGSRTHAGGQCGHTSCFLAGISASSTHLLKAASDFPTVGPKTDFPAEELVFLSVKQKQDVTIK